MNCRHIKKILIPFLESELSQIEMDIIKAHLHKCADCRKEKLLQEQTWSMLDAFEAPRISSNFTADLMAKIHAQKEVKPGLIRVFPAFNLLLRFRMLAPALVSVCILIVVYLFVQNQMFQALQSAKDFSFKEETILQSKKDISIGSQVNVAEVTLIGQEEDIHLAATEFVEDVRAKITAIDEEIIRNLDVYENIELYQNYALFNDLDVVENLDAEVL
ncbi:MAG: zf-HC2 domain-containing protein [Candidatus Omnitrophica bacterium]|nr:zf-HC2 domain-containing protein [Candidatus Omnitrophota bacterium]